jgi:hypothetical protein
MELLKNSSLGSVVKRIVMAPPYTTAAEGGDSSRFVMEGVVGSANHCCAIQSLLEQTDADVVIFSDYDMAFLTHGWDEKIIEILETQDLCGVEYPNRPFPFTLVADIEMHLQCHNYQKLPNLSFLAITRKCIETYFPNGISTFHHYLSAGGLPTQIVNIAQMGNILNLPVGSVWWMDSGFEIPFVIQNQNLKYQTFVPLAFNEQTIFPQNAFTGSAPLGSLPDVFIDSRNNKPFLAHYGKGTEKSLEFGNNEIFDNFKAAVNGYLANQQS